MLTITSVEEIIRLNNVHRHMMRRCYEVKTKGYKDYGGRGIYVCDEWHNSAVFCLWAIENGSAKGLQLDRIDNDGPYAPWNCAFVSTTKNMNNRRNSVFLTAFDETKTMSEWSRDTRCVVAYHTVKQRVHKLGWPVERALTTPSRMVK
jgi:hypothetical protein